MAKIGRTISELAIEIERQQNTKRDFVADTRNVTMDKDLALLFGDQTLKVNELAHDQIGSHTKIPAPYYDKMKAEAPDLLATNVNRWFQKYPAPRMIRTLDNRARAFLSDRYRPLDNFDLLEAALPRLMDLGVVFLSQEVTDTRLYIKVVDQRIKKDLPVGWKLDNRGHKGFDTLSPALILSNSEVGAGALSVQTSVYTGGCTNLVAIRERSARKYHVGGKHELGDEVYAMLSDSTKRLSDAALWATIRDVVAAAFDRAKFDAVCEKLEAATHDRIEGDPAKAVELTAKRFGMNDGERGSVLRHLIDGGDLSKYGLHSAITRAAQDIESYDRASHFEQIGGTVIELPKNEWKEIIKAAELKEAA